MSDYKDYKVIKGAGFRQIKDCHQIKGETIKQFIDDVVYKHPCWMSILLQNLSDIYVLVANLYDECDLKDGLYDECDLKDGEKTWKEIMKKEDYDILKKNKTLIIGYMMVSERSSTPNVHYIDLFDTIVRNYNLGEVMIGKYYDINEVLLWPKNIIPTSAKYWANVLDLCHEDKNTGKYCIDKKTIDDHIKSYKLDSKELQWEHLYNICDSGGTK